MKHLKLYEQYLNNNFKKWFGDSKIVDKDGNPMVMYHGSPHIDKINIFKNDNGYHFFSSSIEEAKRYTPGYWENGRDYIDQIGSFYLKSENPFDVQNMTSIEQESFTNLLKTNTNKYLEFLEKSCDIIYDALEYKFDNIESIEVATDEEKLNILLYLSIEHSENYYMLEHKITQEWIIGNGYDGFYTKENGYGINIAVYKSNQIKSATSNNGLFSNSDNIRENLK